ncbi:MAG: menaquinol-cytochrome c reductase cytochrome b subunit [Acidimicrobiia bacterium]
MADIPEHLLKRAAARKAALEGGGDAAAAETPAATPEPSAPAADAPAPAAPVIEEATESKGGIPAHLLNRGSRRKAALAGGDAGAAPAAAGAGAVAARAAIATPVGTGPDGHTHRLLTVVKSGSIQQTKAEAQDKVHTWPHLLSIELVATLALLLCITIFSALVKAPLLTLADVNKTPNPSKAPWYFLGLQELLTMFNPMVAGVTVPGIGLVFLAFSPYVDKNPSNKPRDRKFAISMFTMFLMMWAVLVIIGSFFRGEGFNFVMPWNNGTFFEL